MKTNNFLFITALQWNKDDHIFKEED